MSEKIQLYSLATPNGQKVSIALEEMGLEYTPHTINILTGDQFTEEFIKLNPNSKIPTISDPAGPDGKPIAVMESGAILLYLAEKTGQFLSTDARTRMETLQWLFFQMGGAGPMFGQFGHFYKFAAEKCDHPYPVERYKNETRRLLKVIDTRLKGREFIAGESYSIADMAIAPWVRCLDTGYGAYEFLNVAEFNEVNRWTKSIFSRPKTITGLDVCSLNQS
ncbi:MAG: glutathione S-transferase [Bacteriovoracaceae bacterium]|jgi:GSH-dependent disulfide-bond oxidoreductase|nr:glutathione S-transferase [Bacteriovoracaceae bacterium]